ncbi:fructose-specific PTS transporter subunit EIIC [Corynebacterium ammoniagenes]|uniref:Phosphotransferase system, EIIC n=1 Tax=Corynebacterium ammoniagenes DSM 20306 TaxID=649754 RepID=A0ABP2IA38_CORAM|nr:fructose-specific PTS transporter subunit EIIC [Corynebacterium ammoniagenes]APT82077.1 PTS mannose transporter subunit IIABC [Corynebacterium ammoniagenes DSM 20306]AQS73185.1 PTS mannose transporter subunit IIABC [Corynebacterium ammoniagenes]EFG80373.1 phosphotransferase system, EIIC [Corynebacterium ammoniagenes DSM 20306]NMF31858.1 PTS transporter subunit EIIA [Corynebacterium ammoniagenes]
MTNKPLILAITACPTGIAHTYMAAENLEAAAEDLGYRIKIETHGSIGVEGHFTAEDIENADAILIGADTVINKERFVGKRLIATGVDVAIKKPKDLLQKSLEAPTFSQAASTSDDSEEDSTNLSFGQTLYKALMNGVSHMIPFVVTGGLLLALSLSIGGNATAEGLVIPEDSPWMIISQIGDLAFSLMIPVLSGYIAVGIADRPGLAPGLITGLIAVNGDLYGSEANAGFIGGIITGILSGYVALAIKKIPVHKFVAPIWPIIVIPIITTVVVGLLFIYLIGAPVASLFDALTVALSGMQGASTLVLGGIIGAMIAADMGGPFNKTAFLFGGGLIAAGNPLPMGMAATAIAVPPLAVGVATLLRRTWFNKAEKDSGIAALFMGFFGITEGAIPLAAARPLQVIPANIVGGAVAGALAGMFSVADNVMHGGPIVAVFGAVDNVFGFFIAMAAGVVVNALLILVLVGVSQRRNPKPEPESEPESTPETTAAASPVATKAKLDTALIDEDTIVLDASFNSRDEAISSLVDMSGTRFSDPDAVIEAALAREAQHSTSVDHQVAIPHARSSAVSVPTLAFARVVEPGVVWAENEEPSRLIFLIAVPEDAGKAHLKLLSKLARNVMKQEFRDELYAANTPEDAAASIQKVLD